MPLTQSVLVASALLAWFLQFFTPLFELARPLGLLFCVCNFLGGAAVIGLALADAPSRRKLTGVFLGLVVAGGALWALSAKLGYQRTLASDLRYTLPHQYARYPGGTDVRLLASDGVKIGATYLGGQHRRGVVIYPSWLSGRHGFSISAMGLWLAEEFSVLVLDPRGVGDSGGWQGPGGEGKWDLLAAVSYLRDRGVARVGVLAEGDGSIAAAMAVVEQRGVDALALAGPPGAWGEAIPSEPPLLSPTSQIGRAYWRVAAGVRLGGSSGPLMADIIGRVAPVPLFLLGSLQDPSRQANQLFQAAGEPRSFRLVAGSGRPVSWQAFAEYFEAVRGWFQLVLSSEDSSEVRRPQEGPAQGGASPDDQGNQDNQSYPSGQIGSAGQLGQGDQGDETSQGVQTNQAVNADQGELNGQPSPSTAGRIGEATAGVRTPSEPENGGVPPSRQPGAGAVPPLGQGHQDRGPVGKAKAVSPDNPPADPADRQLLGEPMPIAPPLPARRSR